MAHVEIMKDVPDTDVTQLTNESKSAGALSVTSISQGNGLSTVTITWPDAPLSGPATAAVAKGAVAVVAGAHSNAINRKNFFDGVRAKVFHGMLNHNQVDSMNAILDEYEKCNLTDLRWLADMLGTVYRECGSNMAPVRESFATSDAQARQRLAGASYATTDPETGQSYYGRGLVQLTHKGNYAAQGQRLGMDLVNNPDLALEPHVAADIMFHGMINGDFTGKKLADYFNNKTEDWINARRIINGLDHAAEVAAVSRTFFDVLRASQASSA